jgi:16S rRNA (guanine966-N2)-methyltransferase
LRVVAGRYKGHPLRAPRSAVTRPTADRVREAIFAMLGDVESAQVLDLFAGSGALGIEALSRGAHSAVFVDRDRSAQAAARANLELTVRRDPEADQKSVRVVGGDARRALERQARRIAAGDEGFDLVFVDPPYRSVASVGTWLTELLPDVMPDGGRIVVECDRRAPLVFGFEAQDSLPMPVEREYGDTLVRIVRLAASGSDRAE